jgi:hypothetical protein
MDDFEILIGISGKATAGKDTFADFLLEEFSEYNMIKIAYADSLKRKLMNEFDLSWEQVYGTLKEVPDERYRKPIRPFCCGLGKSELPSNYWTPREIMQFVGTDCYRHVDPMFWVKALYKHLDNENIKNAIVTDCRFISEVDAVLDRGGHHIRIFRDDADKIHGTTHQSEVDLDNYEDVDFKIYNNGTIEELKSSAVTVAKLIKEEIKNGEKRFYD